MSRYTLFDRSRLRLRPLAEREHDMHLDSVMALDAPVAPYTHANLPLLADCMVAARKAGRPLILMMGAHVIRQGNSLFLRELLRRGLLTHVAGNGACAIHDYEMARIGATSESVARYIRDGQFGLWRETGEINQIVSDAAGRDLGLGEALGKAIAESDFPHRELSVFANAYQLGVPATVHVGIGYDIIHEHPNFDGAACGKASYTDFLIFAAQIENLEGGVLLDFGSAVMGPEVYLKALSMARNVARQEGREICHFTTAVFDLIPIDGDYRRQPSKSEPGYYYRPWKTILVRTVADGGESYYFCGDHRQTVPALFRLLAERMGGTPWLLSNSRQSWRTSRRRASAWSAIFFWTSIWISILPWRRFRWRRAWRRTM